MRVTIIARTIFLAAAACSDIGHKWKPEAGFDDASALAEYAGRQCYESWGRPNPATATNAGYLANILDHEHYSVMEHGSATVRISDVSRALSHEIVRHRHMSISQFSQRYGNLDGESFVLAPLFYDNEEVEEELTKHWLASVELYNKLVDAWMTTLLAKGVPPIEARKRSREAARSVLPNMTPTAFILTGNHRAWRDLIEKRGSLHADAEIRELAVELLWKLEEIEPNLYQDFRVLEAPVGNYIHREAAPE